MGSYSRIKDSTRNFSMPWLVIAYHNSLNPSVGHTTEIICNTDSSSLRNNFRASEPSSNACGRVLTGYQNLEGFYLIDRVVAELTLGSATTRLKEIKKVLNDWVLDQWQNEWATPTQPGLARKGDTTRILIPNFRVLMK